MRGYPRMLVLVRRDLDMPAGKLAVQVAHACVRLISTGVRENEGRYLEWFDPELGNETKIVLSARDDDDLERQQGLCVANGIPCSLVTDAGRTVFREPTVTCLGIGPATEEESRLFRRYRLYEEK